MTWRERLDDARHGKAWRMIRKPIMALVILAGFLAVEYWLAGYVGILDAILYSFLFVVGVAFFPFFIAIAGADLPMNTTIGRWHILLGAIAFNHHYLVDRGDTWEWCPGEDKRVFIDNEWHEIEAGFENRSVLGWRPFGILRYKNDDDAFASVRVDTKAQRDRGHPTAADGGAAIARGNYDGATLPAVSGVDGEWVVDLKRLFSRGVRKFGDVELIETAEEVIERGEVTPSSFDGWRSLIAAVMGLAFGIVVGYIMFFAG